MTACYSLLKQRWSPEQVSGRIKISHNIKISHERIYQFIYKDKSSGGLLHQYLCRKKNIISVQVFMRHEAGSAQRQALMIGLLLLTSVRLGDWS